MITGSSPSCCLILKSGAMLLADRGYDADWIRAFAGEHGAWANIPPKRNRKDPICFSPYLYRARNLVERFFNRIKQCRRVATRYDKLAANYLAFIKLAAIRIWLRAYESRPSVSVGILESILKMCGGCRPGTAMVTMVPAVVARIGRSRGQQ